MVGLGKLALFGYLFIVIAIALPEFAAAAVTGMAVGLLKAGVGRKGGVGK